MKLIYVTHPKVVMERVAIIAKDQEDLDAKLAEREKLLRECLWKPKVERDKTGAPLFHELNEDWENFVAETWNPGP